MHLPFNRLLDRYESRLEESRYREVGEDQVCNLILRDPRGEATPWALAVSFVRTNTAITVDFLADAWRSETNEEIDGWWEYGVGERRITRYGRGDVRTVVASRDVLDGNLQCKVTLLDSFSRDADPALLDRVADAVLDALPEALPEPS